MNIVPFHSQCRVWVRVLRGVRAMVTFVRRRPVRSSATVVIPIEVNDGRNLILPQASHVEIHYHYHSGSEAPPRKAGEAPRKKKEKKKKR